MTMQEDIAEALASLRASEGEQMFYRRGTQPCLQFPILAIRGSTLFRTTNDRGMTLISRSTDFLIGVNQLSALPGGIPFEGDQVVRILGTREQVYEVVRFNQEPHWRWSDPGETQLRVHTKLLRTDPSFLR